MDAVARETLIAALAADAAPSDEIRRAATAAAAELAPAIIERLETAAAGAFPLPHEARLIEHGLGVLAAARRTEAMPAFLRFLTRASAAANYVLGWNMVDGGARIAVGLFDDDAEALTDAVADSEIDETGCWTLMRAAAELARTQRVPHAAALHMLERFDEERLHPDDSLAWEGWRMAAIALGDPTLGERVLASLEDGRAPDRAPELREWRERGERLRLGTLRPEDIDAPLPSIEAAPGGSTEDRIDDEDDRARLARSDPACDAALSDMDFDWLDGFLASAPEYARPTVGWIDGFLTALAAGPVTVESDSLAEGILDHPDKPWPDWAAPARAHAGLLLRRHYAAIDRRLAAGRGLAPLLEPGDERPFQSWSEGFMRVVEHYHGDWRPLMEDREARAVLYPVILAATGKANLDRGKPPTDPDEIGAEIEAGMYLLRESFGGKTPDPRTVAPRTGPKIGRNAPCPCGSGKKYKKCCGAAA